MGLLAPEYLSWSFYDAVIVQFSYQTRRNAFFLLLLSFVCLWPQYTMLCHLTSARNAWNCKHIAVQIACQHQLEYRAPAQPTRSLCCPLIFLDPPQRLLMCIWAASMRLLRCQRCQHCHQRIRMARMALAGLSVILSVPPMRSRMNGVLLGSLGCHSMDRRVARQS